MTGLNGLTWVILASLILGKVVGITGCSYAASCFGFPLPDGMNVRDLVVTSVVAGLGLTVALFVSGQAFVDEGLQGAAKMGALLSILAGPLAFVVAIALGVKKLRFGRFAFRQNRQLSRIGN